MLHAFNQKRVRRILATTGEEHTNEKNEDAITSMVFSPLSFMPTGDATHILVTLVGRSLTAAIGDRPPLRHDLQFWPSGLKARSWDGSLESRCEPDLVVRLDFDVGFPVLMIGEFKWDWRIRSGDLKNEIDRQRVALASAAPDAIQVVFTVTKFPLSERLHDTAQLTWGQVHGTAFALARESAGTPVGHWGALVAAFLQQVGQVSFRGFSTIDYPAPMPALPFFWKHGHV